MAKKSSVPSIRNYSDLMSIAYSSRLKYATAKAPAIADFVIEYCKRNYIAITMKRSALIKAIREEFKNIDAVNNYKWDYVQCKFVKI
jgi:hypothetical protein